MCIRPVGCMPLRTRSVTPPSLGCARFGPRGRLVAPKLPYYSNVPVSRALARLAAALSFAYTLRGKALGIPFTALELALVVTVLAYVVEKVTSHEPFPDPRKIPYSWPLALL